MLELAPTPKAAVQRQGCATLLHFTGESSKDVPVLLVPSLINRWYVLDLHEGSSVAQALRASGFDTWCLDWGIPEDEDRFFSWDDVVARLARMVRRVKRLTGAPRVALVGYCVGGTLSAIHAALHPNDVAALVNLAGPIDFSQGGFLTHMVDRRWFDAQAISDAGNVSPEQMQAGFLALRPTSTLTQWVRTLDRFGDQAKMDRAEALETWASDNVSFPAAAYARYIEGLYQDNELAKGTHHVGGRRVDLGQIRCPVLVVTTSHDSICPPEAANALAELSGSDKVEQLCIPGGHVGAVVGSKASTTLYPALTRWLESA
ncbi:alpha/beta fold hydrolase [Endomicrobium sp. AH-315-J14]|nr:alpha/beta fold hydrolase [Endomicrobium sp. AH-315-J14]